MADILSRGDELTNDDPVHWPIYTSLIFSKSAFEAKYHQNVMTTLSYHKSCDMHGF